MIITLATIWTYIYDVCINIMVIPLVVIYFVWWWVKGAKMI